MENIESVSTTQIELREKIILAILNNNVYGIYNPKEIIEFAHELISYIAKSES